MKCWEVVGSWEENEQLGFYTSMVPLFRICWKFDLPCIRWLRKSKVKVRRRWWGSLDSTHGNFNFTIFLTLNNYTQWWTSQEQQPFPRKALCGLKIDSTKTTNWIGQLCLVACVDPVLSAIQMILKILTWCNKFLWQSDNLSFNILQHDAIGWIWLSGQLIISNPVTIPLSDLLSRTLPNTCMTAVDHYHYCTGIPIHYFSCPFGRFHAIWFPCSFGTAITKD